MIIEYLQHPNGPVEPKKIHTGAISAQHAEPLGYTGPEMTTPSMEAIENIKFDQPAVTLYGSHTPFHVKAIRQIYRVMQLTGRKMIIDTMVAKGL